MKKLVLFAIIGIVLPMLSHAQAVEDSELEKTYVEPSQLAFDKHGILALVEGEWIPVYGIHSDACGIYVAHSRHPAHSRWWCSLCNYSNYGGDETCKRWDDVARKYCGNPRPW